MRLKSNYLVVRTYIASATSPIREVSSKACVLNVVVNELDE